MSQSIFTAFQAAKQFLNENPEQAENQVAVQTSIGDRYNVTGKARNFEFVLDEEKSIGSYDSGSNPLEYLLASLGACQSIVYKIIAAQKGIELDDVKINLKGSIDVRGFLDLGENIKPGFKKLQYDTVIVSDEDPRVLQELSREVEASCPVLDILANSLDVKAKLKTLVPQ